MSDNAQETFTVRINGGDPRPFVGATGMYKYAALQAVLSDPSLLPLPAANKPLIVDIWIPRLIPEYGPYHYMIWENERWDGHICVIGFAANYDALDEGIE